VVVEVSMLLGSPGLAVEREIVGRPGEGENPVAAARACWAPVDLGLLEKKLVIRLPFEVEGRLSPDLTG